MYWYLPKYSHLLMDPQ